MILLPLITYVGMPTCSRRRHLVAMDFFKADDPKPVKQYYISKVKPISLEIVSQTSFLLV